MRVLQAHGTPRRPFESRLVNRFREGAEARPGEDPLVSTAQPGPSSDFLSSDARGRSREFSAFRERARSRTRARLSPHRAAKQNCWRKAPADYRLHVQRGLDLSDRMANAFAEAEAAGAPLALLRGSDSPVLSFSQVKKALVSVGSRG